VPQHQQGVGLGAGGGGLHHGLFKRGGHGAGIGVGQQHDTVGLAQAALGPGVVGGVGQVEDMVEAVFQRVQPGAQLPVAVGLVAAYLADARFAQRPVHVQRADHLHGAHGLQRGFQFDAEAGGVQLRRQRQQGEVADMFHAAVAGVVAAAGNDQLRRLQQQLRV
jgi:hypothetical protein